MRNSKQTAIFIILALVASCNYFTIYQQLHRINFTYTYDTKATSSYIDDDDDSSRQSSSIHENINDSSGNNESPLMPTSSSSSVNGSATTKNDKEMNDKVEDFIYKDAKDGRWNKTSTESASLHDDDYGPEDSKGDSDNSTETEASLQQNLSRSEMIRIENIDAFNSNEKIFSHFFSHIPKTGGGYAFWILARLSKFINDEYAAMGLKNQQRPCNEASRHLKYFDSHFRYHFKKVQCNMWMSERPIEYANSTYNHAYSIVRKPRDHVISQYFHCKESKDHEKFAKFMPDTFDDWLDHHVRRYDKAVKENATDTMERRNDFRCYDPIDHQSYFVNFTDTVSEDELMERFDLLGDTNMMEKTICAIHIRYSGNVPPMCDCTEKGKADEDERRRLLDHGVQHHGATFELTEEQEAKIAKITQKDVVLYKRAQRVFEQQLEEIESELGITLCNNPDLVAGLDALKKIER